MSGARAQQHQAASVQYLLLTDYAATLLMGRRRVTTSKYQFRYVITAALHYTTHDAKQSYYVIMYNELVGPEKRLKCQCRTSPSLHAYMFMWYPTYSEYFSLDVPSMRAEIVVAMAFR
jgi:hypothetical protein